MFKKLYSAKISAKIYLLCSVIILAFVGAIVFTCFELDSSLKNGKNEAVQKAVESSWGIVDYYVSQADKGIMTKEEAQSAAKEVVRHLRFEGNNYFWINDLSPKMVMHPIKPEMEGQNLSSVSDPDGKALFVEMAQVAKASGEGFVDYKWAKQGLPGPVGKISFVKLVPEWGWIIGAGLYVDDIAAQISQVLFLIVGIVLVVVLVSFSLVFVLARSLSKPMKQTVEMIQELEMGHLDKRLGLSHNDEVGLMSQAMDRFADSLQYEVVASLQKLAAGDLSFDVQPRDEGDTIRGTLKKLGNDLNEVMGQIQVSGDQIASGANLVSDTSQSLSQGATESASSLEEISASLNELASQTATNADNAKQADNLATDARNAALNGSEQMEAMIAAMNEIDEAGQNISKIIKTIDEIAFQTNLLALNAAVEAARAGQHGKGFAVVAEEVRNLAGRSAKAAEETAELIKGSVQKTENGSTIAKQTSDALHAIVEGVGKVSDLVAEISAASNEQAEGVNQISEGVTQIDQVTQKNTALAEESAAAAEELSGQSAHLREMLQRFALRDAGVFHPREAEVRKPSVNVGSTHESSDHGWQQFANSKQRFGSQPQIALDDSEFGKY